MPGRGGRPWKRRDWFAWPGAKGLREQAVLFRHALRNALIPAVTVIGINVGILLGGSAVIETLFEVNAGRAAAERIRREVHMRAGRGPGA